MPTKILFGQACVLNNSILLKAFGKKAMLVTGKHSAKHNGSQEDVISALSTEGIDYIIYDQVMSNPTSECCYEGAKMAIEHQVDFIIAIGGGSPMDAAKGMALLAKQEINQKQLFNGEYIADALPIIAIPTTAGTGSEVTQYAILTNDLIESKTGIATEAIFPKIAFVDARYMNQLPPTTTINTAIDALSHAIEGILSIRASVVSVTLAYKSIEHFSECMVPLLHVKQSNSIETMTLKERESLANCSTLAGMVIAQTGTTIVHAMGYSLTYFKSIDHGRANGLLLAEYLELVEKDEPQTVEAILRVMGLKSVHGFRRFMGKLLGIRETIIDEEMHQFSEKAIHTGNMNNCRIKPKKEAVVAMYKAAFNE
jgi:alcohol dehydrogenase class IV